LTFKIIAILQNTMLATFIKLLETVSKGLFRNRSQTRCHICSWIAATSAKHSPFMMLFRRGNKEVHLQYSSDLAPAVISTFTPISKGNPHLH
jgi:hypothetical protein